MRALQDFQQIRADGYWNPKRPIAQPHQLAVSLIIAHNLFEVGDATKGALGVRLGAGLVRRIQRDAEQRAHVRAGELKALKRLRQRTRAAGGQQKQANEEEAAAELRKEEPTEIEDCKIATGSGDCSPEPPPRRSADFQTAVSRSAEPEGPQTIQPPEICATALRWFARQICFRITPIGNTGRN